MSGKWNTKQHALSIGRHKDRHTHAHTHTHAIRKCSGNVRNYHFSVDDKIMLGEWGNYQEM